MNEDTNYRNYWIGGIVVVILVIGGIYWYRSSDSYKNETPSDSDTLPTNNNTSVLPYGRVNLGIGDQAMFAGISIRPTAVIEDSRCPTDVQCIQAGTVKVNVAIELDNGARRQETITLGKTATIDDFTILLSSVAPTRKSGTNPSSADYKFTFNVYQGVPTGSEALEGKG